MANVRRSNNLVFIDEMRSFVFPTQQAAIAFEMAMQFEDKRDVALIAADYEGKEIK